jgi:hypothetical protein
VEYRRSFEHELIVHLEDHLPAPSSQQLVVVRQHHRIDHNVRRPALSAHTTQRMTRNATQRNTTQHNAQCDTTLEILTLVGMDVR